jgi:L-2-hydroxyglutarate oxidase LhgO
MERADLLVVGGGIVGIATALEWKRRDPASRVVVLEKEPAVARHASGRNSGVLHAGLYYAPGSLKARFARDGNARLTEYCEARALPIRRCGKLLVATTPAEQATLETLLERGRAAGVSLEAVDQKTVQELEPGARVQGWALFSPTTSSVDPEAVVRALAADARAAGVEIRLAEAFLSWRERDRVVETTGGRWAVGFVLNAAGAHADRVARAFGFGGGYRIMPFMGRYLRAREPVPVSRHIYPVPDLRYPFLGVHVTVAVDGTAWLGPTATPVLGREHYGAFDVGVSEAAVTAARLARLLASPHNSGLRRLAVREVKLRTKGALVRRAARLVDGLPGPRAWEHGRPGIRAQLVDTRRWKLEDDFVYEADGGSCHVLNAVSPAFTCALPLAEHLADSIEGIREF